jgi:hypothetical protein
VELNKHAATAFAATKNVVEIIYQVPVFGFLIAADLMKLAAILIVVTLLNAA